MAKDHNKSLCSQGRVVENISKRCGGFLRKLSLRGCLGVGDSALRWERERMNLIYAEHVFTAKRWKYSFSKTYFQMGHNSVLFFCTFICMHLTEGLSKCTLLVKGLGSVLFFKNVVLLLKNFAGNLFLKMTVKTFIMFCFEIHAVCTFYSPKHCEKCVTLSPKCEAAQLFSTLMIMRFLSAY